MVGKAGVDIGTLNSTKSTCAGAVWLSNLGVLLASTIDFAGTILSWWRIFSNPFGPLPIVCRTNLLSYITRSL